MALFPDEVPENSPLALIIEDEPDAAVIFSMALQQAGYQTEVALDGNEALKRLKVIIPTVVLLDLQLPQVSGKDILQQIRKDSRLAGTKVILATADALRAQSLSESADLILLKPIGFQQLRDLATRLRPRET
jgi:two-component system response regulator BaeR